MVQSPTPDAGSNDALRLERCQQRIGYRFRDVQLLDAALTHASGADHRLSSNERLEFLGDAILGLVVCEQLFQQFPEQLEGVECEDPGEHAVSCLLGMRRYSPAAAAGSSSRAAPGLRRMSRISRQTPAVIAESATLNAGQWWLFQ